MNILETTLFKILSLIVLLIFITIPQLNNNEYISSTVNSKFIYFSYNCFLLLCILLFNILVAKEIKFSISKIDVGLSLFISYVLLNRYFIQDNYGFSIRLFELIGLIFIYLVLRILPLKESYYILCAIIISGILQALYGNLQLLGFYPSNHSNFKMTGSFFNPGPYAGFLTSVWTLSLGMFLFKTRIIGQVRFYTNKNSRFFNILLKYIFEYIPLLSIISVAILLPALQSRASWLAVLFCSTILLEIRYKILSRTLKKLSKTKKIVGFFSINIIIAALLFSLYQFKKGSSDGRLFIWKVTTRIIQDTPFFGHGFDRFKANYMNYQAQYFEKNVKSPELWVADNTYYAFNEYLQLLVENGFIGLGLFLLIIIILFKTQVKQENTFLFQISIIGLLSIAVFGCFSYPMQLLPVKLILVFLLALIANMDNYKKYFKIPSNLKWLLKITILVTGMYLGFKGIHKTNNIKEGFKVWRNATNYYQYGDYNGAIDEYETIYPIFKDNGEFLMNYGKTLSMNKNYNKAIKILEQSKQFLNSTITETALGDSYKAIKQYNKAEIVYQHAANMVPSRFYPNYLLAKLYEESGQREKAISKAVELLEKDVKIQSTAIKEIQLEMKKLIENYDKK